MSFGYIKVAVFIICMINNSVAQICDSPPDYFYPFGLSAGDINGGLNISTYDILPGVTVQGVVVDEAGAVIKLAPGDGYFQIEFTDGTFTATYNVYRGDWSLHTGSYMYSRSATSDDLVQITNQVNDGHSFCDEDIEFTAGFGIIVSFYCRFNADFPSGYANFQFVFATGGGRTMVIYNYDPIAKSESSTVDVGVAGNWIPGNPTPAEIEAFVLGPSNTNHDGHWIFDITDEDPFAPCVTVTSQPKCEVCGGCEKVWSQDDSITNLVPCGTPKRCIKRVHPKSESILNPKIRTRGKEFKRVRRSRRCCYKWSKSGVATPLSTAQRCSKAFVKGWVKQP